MLASDQLSIKGHPHTTNGRNTALSRPIDAFARDEPGSDRAAKKYTSKALDVPAIPHP
jgi:hypothetical protein